VLAFNAVAGCGFAGPSVLCLFRASVIVTMGWGEL
jgi:hypothetical protein